MNKMISFCGTTCTECPAFLATQQDNDIERMKIAELWSRKYSADIKPDDINCDGCLSDGRRIFGYCQVCEVRKCGQGKSIKNCAYCDEFPCKKLNPVFEVEPNNRTTLEGIRQGL